jgi:hypothetical protein
MSRLWSVEDGATRFLAREIHVGIYHISRGRPFGSKRVPPERQAEAGWGPSFQCAAAGAQSKRDRLGFQCDETRAVTAETVTSGRHIITHRISPMVILRSLGMSGIMAS